MIVRSPYQQVNFSASLRRNRSRRDKSPETRKEHHEIGSKKDKERKDRDRKGSEELKKRSDDKDRKRSGERKGRKLKTAELMEEEEGLSMTACSHRFLDLETCSMCNSIFPRTYTKKLKFRYFCVDCLNQLEETERKFQQKREENIEQEEREKQEALQMEQIVVEFIRKTNSASTIYPSRLYK